MVDEIGRPMTDIEVLTAAADLIERCGLHRGDYWPGAKGRAEYVPGDPCCPQGAFAVVTGSTKYFNHPAEVLLERHIGDAVGPWSDKHSRGEVVAALREVAATCCGRYMCRDKPGRWKCDHCGGTYPATTASGR